MSIRDREASEMANTRPQRLDGIEENNLWDEMVLYSPAREMAFSLNPSAKGIWELCDGRRTVLEIARELGRRFDGSDTEMLSDILEAVSHLRELGLLKPEEAPPPKSA